MKKILSIYLSVCVFAAHAQFMTDVNGRPVVEYKYTDIDGSPYLKSDWSIGIVKTPNGKTYEIARVRYDAYKDELEYDQAGKYFRLGPEIAEFSSGDGTFRNGFPDIDNLNKRSFYQVLYDGKTKVLKKISIRIVTEKPYGSATEVKRFLKDEHLFLFKNNMMSKLKRDKKSILSLLENQTSELENFIKDQKLKLSKEEDILKLVEKYDSL